MHSSIKISGNFNIKNIYNGAKQIYPKKQKVLRRDILRISVAVIQRFNVKKVPFIFKI